VRLILLHRGELQAPDERLQRLAEFLGIVCQPLALPAGTSRPIPFFEKVAAEGDSCLVVNPGVIKSWLGAPGLPEDLGRCWTSRFRGLLVHNLNPDPFADSVVRALSGGGIDGIGLAEDKTSSYTISGAGRGITGPFAGLTFGPTHPGERVFEVRNGALGVVPLISIAGRVSFAISTGETNRAFFLGGADIADLNSDVAGAQLADYFSQIVPPVMALRALCPDACWVPNRPHGTLIIDDPLLRKNYGFMNYERLLALMDEYNFHTTIAFIPHNYRRSSPAVVRMFHARPDRLSICYHGNDHSGAEFAERNLGKLNAMLSLAETRMGEHAIRTGVECNRVMVFPQGEFSPEAMASLQAHNFIAAVNTSPYAAGEAACLPLFQVMQPAVQRFDGFPLFLRCYVRDFRSEDIACHVFFGRPILIVEHHDIFQDPGSLIDLVSRINELVPEMHWCPLEAAVSNSYLMRSAGEGVLAVRMFSPEGLLRNSADTATQVSIEWEQAGSLIDKLFVNDALAANGVRGDTRTSVRFYLAPGESSKFRIVFRNDLPDSGYHFGRKWKAKALLRRRLSEFRDNYLSKNAGLLAAAKVLQRRFLGKVAG
jgi:hypothetical protein